MACQPVLRNILQRLEGSLQSSSSTGLMCPAKRLLGMQQAC